MLKEKIPIRILLGKEIKEGLINQDKLERKIAAFLEFVNSEIKAFDAKSGEKRRLSFNDAVTVSFYKNKKKIPILIISPRFEKSQYVASCILFGAYDINGQPFFSNNPEYYK